MIQLIITLLVTLFANDSPYLKDSRNLTFKDMRPDYLKVWGDYINNPQDYSEAKMFDLRADLIYSFDKRCFKHSIIRNRNDLEQVQKARRERILSKVSVEKRLILSALIDERQNTVDGTYNLIEYVVETKLFGQDVWVLFFSWDIKECLDKAWTKKKNVEIGHMLHLVYKIQNGELLHRRVCG